MIKVVLDTNIVVSANLKTTGMEAMGLRLAINRNILMHVSSPVLEEYQNILRRPKFNFAAERI